MCSFRVKVDRHGSKHYCVVQRISGPSKITGPRDSLATREWLFGVSRLASLGWFGDSGGVDGLGCFGVRSMTWVASVASLSGLGGGVSGLGLLGGLGGLNWLGWLNGFRGLGGLGGRAAINAPHQCVLFG